MGRRHSECTWMMSRFRRLTKDRSLPSLPRENWFRRRGPRDLSRSVECAVWAALVYAVLKRTDDAAGLFAPATGFAALFGLGPVKGGCCSGRRVIQMATLTSDYAMLHYAVVTLNFCSAGSGSPADKCFPPGWAGASRTCIVGHPGAEARCIDCKSESNFMQLTLSMAAIGITFTILAVFAPGFSITASVGSIVSIPVAGAVISVCMFGGSLVSARFMMRRFHAEMADNQDNRQENACRYGYGSGCATHSRWERYAADDWFPHGGMAGRARLRAIRCDACRPHRQIRFDGKILVMTVASVTHRTRRQNPTNRATPTARSLLAGSRRS